MLINNIIPFVLCFLLTNALSTDKCIALSMSGGGSMGAFEAGALYGLYHTNTDKTKFKYDVITAVSAGAVNLAAVAVFEIGDEEAMIQVLSNEWQSLKNNNVYKEWSPFGMITGLFS